MANLITGYAVETNTANGYLAPEQLYVCLTGGVAETRGRLVHTGWIVSINGTTVQTLSGSTYELGEPASGEVGEVVEQIRGALARFQPGEALGYHPATLRCILALRD